MATIALIGADGSGKTTIAKMLLHSPPAKLKYLYMGLNIESSNYALPTSRLIFYLKLLKYKKKNKNLKNVKLKNLSLHDIEEDRTVDKRGKLGAFARLANRMAEAWYRQFISWLFQLKGYVVLYDRHYLFDASTNHLGDEAKNQRLTSKIHWWLLNNMYSKPDLVFLLHAPPEVLYERKREADIEYLKMRTENFIKVGSKLKNFIIIDATQPIDKVFEDVFDNSKNFLKKKKQSY
jgi:thymidylate kinase